MGGGDDHSIDTIGLIELSSAGEQLHILPKVGFGPLKPLGIGITYSCQHRSWDFTGSEAPAWCDPMLPIR